MGYVEEIVLCVDYDDLDEAECDWEVEDVAQLHVLVRLALHHCAVCAHSRSRGPALVPVSQWVSGEDVDSKGQSDQPQVLLKLLSILIEVLDIGLYLADLNSASIGLCPLQIPDLI